MINGLYFNLTIWDTAGEEKYHALAPIFYRGSDGAIIIYDCTKRETFESAEKWFKELNELSEHPRIILVGNKIDLPNKKVNAEDAKKLSEKYNGNFLEVSALTGKNINEIFDSITLDIYNYKKKCQEEINDKLIEEKAFGKERRKRAASQRKMIIVNDRFDKRNDTSTCC